MIRLSQISLFCVHSKRHAGSLVCERISENACVSNVLRTSLLILVLSGKYAVIVRTITERLSEFVVLRLRITA